MRIVFFDDKTSNTLLWLNTGHARKEKRWSCYHCTFSAEVAASSSFHASCIVHAGHSTVDSPSILLHKVEAMFKNSLCTLQILKVKVISVSVTNLLDVYSIFYPLPL